MDNGWSIERRIGLVEQTVAKLEQRADALEYDLRAFAPLVREHAEIQTTLRHVDTNVKALRQALEEDRKARNEETKDDRAGRRMWVSIVVAGLSVVVMAIGLIVQILA